MIVSFSSFHFPADDRCLGGIIKIGMAFILIMSIIAGIYYESVIRRYFPAYSAILFVSGIVCFAGFIYALIMRNLFIALLTIIGTAAIPWLVNWFMVYWPFVSDRFINLK